MDKCWQASTSTFGWEIVCFGKAWKCFKWISKAQIEFGKQANGMPCSSAYEHTYKEDVAKITCPTSYMPAARGVCQHWKCQNFSNGNLVCIVNWESPAPPTLTVHVLHISERIRGTCTCICLKLHEKEYTLMRGCVPCTGCTAAARKSSVPRTS